MTLKFHRFARLLAGIKPRPAVISPRPLCLFLRITPMNLIQTVRRSVLLLCTALAVSSPALAINVVTNGSFEAGLAGWTVAAPSVANPAATTCSFNQVVAPGLETIYNTLGLAAAAGANTVLGSITQTNASPGFTTSCVLYQDVFIPVGATTATLSANMSIRYFNLKDNNGGDIRLALYPTATVPNRQSFATPVGSPILYSPGAVDVALVPFVNGPFPVAALAGTTVRLAFIIGSLTTVGYAVGNLDNVVLDVTVPVVATTTVPTLSQWGLLILALLVGTVGVALRRRDLGSK
jgi:IPTL-CTERM motif